MCGVRESPTYVSLGSLFLVSHTFRKPRRVLWTVDRSRLDWTVTTTKDLTFHAAKVVLCMGKHALVTVSVLIEASEAAIDNVRLRESASKPTPTQSLSDSTLTLTHIHRAMTVRRRTMKLGWLLFVLPLLLGATTVSLTTAIQVSESATTEAQVKEETSNYSSLETTTNIHDEPKTVDTQTTATDKESQQQQQAPSPVVTEHKRLSSVMGAFVREPPGVLLEENNDPKKAANWYLENLLDTSSLRLRLTDIFRKARTPECRQKIATHLNYFLGAVGREEHMPFARTLFTNECPEPVYDDWNNLPEDMHIGMIQNRTYQPPRNESVYIGDPNELKLLYAVLAHTDPEGTIRLIEALYDDGHVFVVHVDGKEASQETYTKLSAYASTRDHVFILPDPLRVRITWGGFSMVNATLQVLQYAFGLAQYDGDNGTPISKPLDFHKVVHLASTSYPLASNTQIRHRLASFPLDANFMHVIMKPSRPYLWNYFVECDDAVHRIHRLPVLQTATAGANLFTSSQWWIISREFAEYLARAEPGTFVHQFLDYVEHVVVADETFFGTVLRHTEFCLKHHNRNFLHLQFDRWESDLPEEQRDESKCMMKDRNQCGRSPTTMTVEYADILELSDDLFARKFVDSNDSQVKDIVDTWRAKREATMLAKLKNASQVDTVLQGMDFEGHGVLIVARETVDDKVPLCMALGESGNAIQLLPCFHPVVVPNLLEGWEAGGVVQSETQLHTRWEMSPCTSDGSLERNNTTGTLSVTQGNYSVTGPRCMLKQMDGVRAGRCFDGDTGAESPGGETLVFPCVQRWGQFLSAGDDIHAPQGSLFFHIPAHVIRAISKNGVQQHAYMCLTVGNVDDEGNTDSTETKSHRPLSEWIEHPIISVPCTDKENIIEWVFVPYIVEQFEESSMAAGNSSIEEDGTGENTLECIAQTCRGDLGI